MFRRKKKHKTIDISEHPFVQGYQDCMKMACVEFFGRYYWNWGSMSIEEQAYHVVDRYPTQNVSLTASFEDWLDPAYMNGVVEYSEFLAEAVKNERARRRVHRRSVKVMM